MFRQGDVLLVPCKKEDMKDTVQGELEQGRIVLAHGETTGHAHAMDPQGVDFVVNQQTMDRYLNVKKVAKLKHEEHGEIEIPVGTYRVVRQREWTPSDWQTVQD